MRRAALYPNLEAELVRARMSKSELAERLNISRATMSSRFTGKTRFKINEAKQIQDILNDKLKSSLTIFYLFNITNEED